MEVSCKALPDVVTSTNVHYVNTRKQGRLQNAAWFVCLVLHTMKNALLNT